MNQTDRREEISRQPGADALRQVAGMGQLGAAMQNVRRAPRSYISFFLALLVIQTLLCLLLTAAAQDVRSTGREIYSRYDYDVSLLNISQPQYAVMHNADMEIPPELRFQLPYTDLRYERLENGNYNVYITLRGDDLAVETEMLQMGWIAGVAAAGDGLVMNYSPHYNYHAYRDRMHFEAGVAVVLLLALSTFLLVMLQRTRLHHEKYQYGIYMTFGAGYRQLFTTAAGELLYVVLVTALPALLLGNLFSGLLCIGTGTKWLPSLGALLLTPLLTVAVSWISVRFPVKRLSAQTPVALLRAGDNSNLVASPQRSLRVFGRSFPFHYELFSLWRYRRYIAGLLLSAMLFASLWLGLVRVADFNTAKENTAAPEFTVTFDPAVPTAQVLNTNVEEVSAAIEQLEGVDYCTYSVQASIMEMRGFMAISRKAARRAGNYVVYSKDVTGEAHPYATNLVDYVAYNRQTLDRLTARSAHIDGDPYAVLEDDRNVILTTAINNTSRFDFSPGDTVLLATNKMTAMTTVMTTSNLDLLRMMLAEEEYFLEEYRVCAVIRDEAAGNQLRCGVSHAAYRALTGKEAYTQSLQVYLQEGADFGTLDAVDAGVREIAGGYYSTAVLPHGDLFSRRLDHFRNLSGRIITAAYLLLIMMPLFSFFSQRVFYQKRTREWFLLKTLGAPRILRTRLLLISGVLLTAVNFAVMLPVGLLADFLAFKLCNEWLPAGGFVTSALMQYHVSPIIAPVLLLFALLCGFAPCLVEYLHVRRGIAAEDALEMQLARERDEYQNQTKEDLADVSEKNNRGA